MYPTLEFGLVSFSLIFFIVDPLGNIPIFLAMTQGATPAERRRIAFRASAVTLLILLFFALTGEWILRLFRVTIGSFQVAGGILIFIIALSMLQAMRSRTKSSPEEENERSIQEDISIFPLAIPMLSGPAAITTVMVLVSLSTSFVQRLIIVLAIFVTCILTYFILRESGRLLSLLGQTGINVLTRLMGLILAVIAVQFVVDGLKQIYIDITRGETGGKG